MNKEIIKILLNQLKKDIILQQYYRFITPEEVLKEEMKLNKLKR